MKEVLKPLSDYKDAYYVSSKGYIISVKRPSTNGGILLPKFTNGYLRVGLSINGKQKWEFVHRLVAIAFIPNPENKPQVNHINGIKTDNRVENLEWATRKENALHSLNVIKSYKIRENHGRAKLTEIDVAEIKTSLLKYKHGMYSELSKKYNVYKTTIRDIHIGKRWIDKTTLNTP